MARKASAATTGRAPVPSLREQQKRLTRSRLLEAAAMAFNEKGFAETSIDDIVEQAGASRGTYYLYFKSKQELVDELMKPFVADAETLAGELAELADGGKVTTEQLGIWIESFAAMYATHRDAISAWLQADQADEMRATSHMEGIMAQLTRLVRAVRSKEDAGDQKADRVRALLMMVQLERFCYFWLIRSWKADRKTVIATTAEIWYSTLYGRAE